MIRPVKVGKNKWVAGTKDRFSGLHSVDPVNVRRAPSPAPLKNPFKPITKKLTIK